MDGFLELVDVTTPKLSSRIYIVKKLMDVTPRHLPFLSIFLLVRGAVTLYATESLVYAFLRWWKQTGKWMLISDLPIRKMMKLGLFQPLEGSVQTYIDIIVGRFKGAEYPDRRATSSVWKRSMGAVTERFARFQPIDLNWSEVLMYYGRNRPCMVEMLC